MTRFVRAYGARPLHLLALLASFGLTGYVALRVVQAPHWLAIAAWFVGAAVAHDLVLYPLYALADQLAQRFARSFAPLPVPWLNYVRIPALLSGLLLLLWFPLITGLAEPGYRAASGLSTAPFLGRWLLVAGVAFAISAVSYALRLRQVSRALRVPDAGPAPARRSGGPRSPR